MQKGIAHVPYVLGPKAGKLVMGVHKGRDILLADLVQGHFGGAAGFNERAYLVLYLRVVGNVDVGLEYPGILKACGELQMAHTAGGIVTKGLYSLVKAGYFWSRVYSAVLVKYQAVLLQEQYSSKANTV